MQYYVCVTLKSDKTGFIGTHYSLAQFVEKQ